MTITNVLVAQFFFGHCKIKTTACSLRRSAEKDNERQDNHRKLNEKKANERLIKNRQKLNTYKDSSNNPQRYPILNDLKENRRRELKQAKALNTT